MPDIHTILLAAAVLALLGWFFWSVIARMIDTARYFSRLLDERSARQRAALEGPVSRPTPVRLVAVRVILLGTLAGLLAYQFAGKFQIR